MEDYLMIEFELFDGVCVGVDEAGRGPVAGPVVAAAVVLDASDEALYQDSKACSEKTRMIHAAHLITHAPAWAVSVVDAATIDEVNILQATLLAMKRAVAQIKIQFDQVLVDGNRLPDWGYPAKAIVKGDQRVRCIAAASIMAKVFRDELMLEMDEQYPIYGFKQHKGYPTKAHLLTLEKHGPCVHHRKSFGPVAKYQSMTLL